MVEQNKAQDLVSIIIPVKTINQYIRKAIPYLLTLDYPNFEIIIVTDKKEKSPWETVKIISSGIVGPAKKRDLGEKNAAGKYIALIDDDAYPKSDWLKKALKHFKDKKVAAVCGPGISPPFTRFLEQVSDNISTSKLCWGNATFRNKPEGKVRAVDDYITANLIVRRSDYQKAGGFATTYWPGEDTSFCLNIVEKLRKKIIYDPEVIVYHYRRPFGSAYLKQVGGYGLHRGYFAKILPKTSLRLPYFIPSFFVIGGVGGILAIGTKIAIPTFAPYLLDKVISIYITILGTYGVLLVYELIKTLLKRRNVWTALLTPPGIIAVHVVYGMRFAQGFLLTRNLISKLRQ